MNSDSKGNWCVFYSKIDDNTNWHTMKLQRSDGVLVSAKTYDEVFKFVRYKDAFNFVKDLITVEPHPKYNATVKRVCRQRGEGFYLSGS
jgi:hypothetical protein